jgi:hypothetical protein
MTLPDTFKKLVAAKHADTFREAVEVREADLAPPAPDEIIVKTAYSGVNAADYLMAAGRYLSETPPPFDLGAESTGHVVAVGDEVGGYKEGDAVMAIAAGGYRDYFTMKARRAVPVPDAVPEVVALGVSGLTASIALEVVGQMGSDETVLVTAAAGGTGNFAVQLAKLAGNHVIGTCGTPEKVELLHRLGCDRPINYREEDVAAVLKDEYAAGMDVIFECVGGKLYDIALNALGVMGRMVLIGAISEYESGPQPVTRPRVMYKLLSKSASLRGFWLMHYIRYAPEHTRNLLQLMGEGKLQVPIDETSFKGAAGAIDAIEYLYSGENVGKVVVDFT